MSVRTDRIGASIRKALQESLARGINDPRVRGLITVTAVDVSPDLRTATVRVSILPESAQDLTMHGLRSAAGRLRRDIGATVRMKRIPELVFQLDDTLKRQARVLSAIAQGIEESEKRGDEGAGGAEGDAEESLEGEAGDQPDQSEAASDDPADDSIDRDDTEAPR